MSMSHFMIELKLRSKSISARETKERHPYTVSWIPWASSPSMPGWKRTSGVRKLGGRISPGTVVSFKSPYRSLPMVRTCPSGSS